MFSGRCQKGFFMKSLRTLWPDGSPALRRWQLRRAALGYADRGWPVVAGACFTGTRFSCGPGCQTFACHPALAPWEEHATVDLDALAQIWSRRPYAVLLATGYAFDVLEVPAYMGVDAARSARAPVAVTPLGRWMFLVGVGARLAPALGGHHDVVLHGPGSWIPAPPVRSTHGRVRWVVTPQETDWQVPEPDSVQAALITALPAQPYPLRFAA
jgi:hypothetical protein